MNLQIERWSEADAPDALELRKRLEAEGYTVREWTDAAGTRYGPHEHAEDQTHWIISGELQLHVGHETYILRAGDRDLLPARTQHTASVPNEQPVTYLIGVKY